MLGGNEFTPESRSNWHHRGRAIEVRLSSFVLWLRSALTPPLHDRSVGLPLASGFAFTHFGTHYGNRIRVERTETLARSILLVINSEIDVADWIELAAFLC